MSDKIEGTISSLVKRLPASHKVKYTYLLEHETKSKSLKFEQVIL